MKLHINKKGVLLADAISEFTGISLPCGGKGRCGGCGVFAYGELDSPSEAEKKLLERYPDGWRLACKAICLGEVTVELDIGNYAILSNTDESFGVLAPMSQGKFGAAVDIGTTTLAAKLIDTATGEVISSSEAMNPQIIHGADVITRVEYALNGGGEVLRDLILSGISSLLSELTKEYIDTVVLVGNTAMLTILMGGDVSGLGYAPFKMEEKFGRFVDAAQLSCEAMCRRFYIMPCISPFVGADITSAVLASPLLETPNALLADIGTNGELVLHRNGKLFCTSTAAGPAFEGGEITCGMTARDGAITEVKRGGDSFDVTTIGNFPPKGLCAGGVISAIALFLDDGIMDEGGYISKPITIADGVYITPQDIRKLQSAKAAICSGIEILCGDVPCDKIYLAGGIGNYLSITNSIKIGLLPRFASEIVTPVGNTALRGACMILQNEALTERAWEIANNAELIELDANPKFSDIYIGNMLFKK